MRGVFANRWWVVAATVLGLIVGAGSINVFSFGVFLKPITAELVIGRATFSSALTLHATMAALIPRCSAGRRFPASASTGFIPTRRSSRFMRSCCSSPA